ncbi:MAG TPA: manganese efflux pump MntP family protein [Spirochaetota bacterium]|nr:manganese efflux pump MntP family protein [Spirochaetota bacterium]
MDIFTLLIIASALSIDALSVSIANGIIIPQLKTRQAIYISFSFGFFQSIMPVIGWFVGKTFAEYIQVYDHWIAFALLSSVGIKMIHEAYTQSENKTCKNCLQPKILLLMSLATSIDALAIGISFSILKTDILFPAIVIGVVTFINCFAGITIAHKIGSFFGKKMEYAGGIILIAIGVKIVIEHICLCI